MIWDEIEKKWILRRHKKRVSSIPPIIEATKQDAYEVIILINKFRMFLEKIK